MQNDFPVRPKPQFGVSDDAEDEMLNYQELFRRSNTQPSAQVIREAKRQQSIENEGTKKRNPTVDLTQTTVMQPVIVVSLVLSLPFSMRRRNRGSTRLIMFRRNAMSVRFLSNYQHLCTISFHKRPTVATMISM